MVTSSGDADDSSEDKFNRAQGAVIGAIVAVVGSVLFGKAKDSAAKGATTEPTLPPKTIASEGDVTVEHYYRSGDHSPAHAHVKGGGETTRIGPNGKPLAGQPELTGPQQAAVDANESTIRSAVNKIGRWLKSQENK
jgi:hypothetical protein